MKNIIVALDFSDVNASLVSYAVGLAKCTKAKIWLIHVASPDPDFVGFEVGPKYIRDHRAHELRKEHKMLQETAKEVQAQNIACEALLVQGDTVVTLLEKAKDLQADAIVIAAKSHGFLYESLVGSVFRGILENAHIPLFVLPSHCFKHEEWSVVHEQNIEKHS